MRRHVTVERPALRLTVVAWRRFTWTRLVSAGKSAGRRTKLNIVAAGSIEHMSGGMTGEVNSPGTVSCLSGRWNT